MWQVVKIVAEAREMLPEEKFGSLEMPGEVNPMQEEDTSDLPTVTTEKVYQKEEREEDFFWLPF
jgi:hypothetical protein